MRWLLLGVLVWCVRSGEDDVIKIAVLSTGRSGATLLMGLMDAFSPAVRVLCYFYFLEMIEMIKKCKLLMKEGIQGCDLNGNM